MKLITTHTKEWRPEPFPCFVVYQKTIWKLFGIIKVRTKLKKIKNGEHKAVDHRSVQQG